ncbi:hypothetical protein RUND412_003059 [Rhizina undulata]
MADRRSISTVEDSRRWSPRKTAGYLSRSSVASSRSISSPLQHGSSSNSDRDLLNRFNSLLAASNFRRTADTLGTISLSCVTRLYVSFPSTTFSRRLMIGSLDHTTIRFDIMVRQIKIIIMSIARDADKVMTPRLRERLENLLPANIAMGDFDAFRDFLEIVIIVGERIWECIDVPKVVDGRRLSVGHSTPRRSNGSGLLGDLKSSGNRRSVRDSFSTPRMRGIRNGSVVSWEASPSQRKRHSSAELLTGFMEEEESSFAAGNGDSEDLEFSAFDDDTLLQVPREGLAFSEEAKEEDDYEDSEDSSTVKQASVRECRDSTVISNAVDIPKHVRAGGKIYDGLDETAWTDSPISSSCSDIEHISSSFMEELISRCEAVLAIKSSAAGQMRNRLRTPAPEKNQDKIETSGERDIPAARSLTINSHTSDQRTQKVKSEAHRTLVRKSELKALTGKQKPVISKPPSTPENFDLRNKNIQTPSPRASNASRRSSGSNKGSNTDAYVKRTVTKVIARKEKSPRNGPKPQQPRDMQSRKTPSSPQTPKSRGSGLFNERIENDRINWIDSGVSDWETVVSHTFEAPPPLLHNSKIRKSEPPTTPRKFPKSHKNLRKDSSSPPTTKTSPIHNLLTSKPPRNTPDDEDDRTSLYSVSSVSWGTDSFTAAARHKRQIAHEKFQELQDRFDHELDAAAKRGDHVPKTRDSNSLGRVSEENRMLLRPLARLHESFARGSGHGYGVDDIEGMDEMDGMDGMDTDTGLTEVEEELMSVEEQGRREAVRQNDLLKALMEVRRT